MTFVICLFFLTQDVGFPLAGPQQKLRSEWQESEGNSRLRTEFKKKYFYVDIAEETWSYLLAPGTPPAALFTPSKDVPLSVFQTQMAFSMRPFDFRLWGELLIVQLKNMKDRPFDALNEILGHWNLFFIPFLFALIVTFLFYFWMWATPISKDFPKWVGSNARILGLTSLATLLCLTLYTQKWILLLFIFSALAIAYSRKKREALIIASIMASIMSLQPFVSSFSQSYRGLSAIEALNMGRTRLEYSLQDFHGIPILDQVLWANLAEDKMAAKSLLDRLEPSLEKEILAINSEEEVANTTQLIQRYTDLRSRQGDRPLIIYNLSQLLTKNQKLVQADQLRALLTADNLRAFTLRSSYSSRLLLDPLPSNPSLIASQRSRENNAQLFSNLGFSPFNFGNFLKNGLNIISPWLFILIGLFLRKKASGLCSHTGEPTLAPDIETSSLYQASSRKDETTNHTLKVQVDSLVRFYQRKLSSFIKAFCWVFPGLYTLPQNMSIIDAWWRTAIPFFFLWQSLSPSTRVHFAEAVGVHVEPFWIHSTSSFGFLILFLIFYGFFMIQSLRSSQS